MMAHGSHRSGVWKSLIFSKWVSAVAVTMPHFETLLLLTSLFCPSAPPRKLNARHGEQFCMLAERHRLTLYDAAYLELAQRRGLPLATLDRELRTAAGAEKVTLLGV
jgi:predicted nucleic acid-binding protein